MALRPFFKQYRSNTCRIDIGETTYMCLNWNCGAFRAMKAKSMLKNGEFKFPHARAKRITEWVGSQTPFTLSIRFNSEKYSTRSSLSVPCSFFPISFIITHSTTTTQINHLILVNSYRSCNRFQV